MHALPRQNGAISFWYADIGGLPTPRPPLDGDRQADVCIVGAGYTGLWAAYYLKKADPTLDILIVEREFAGFGASGRNGGWLSGGFAWKHENYLDHGSREGVRRLVTAMEGTVAEVIRVAKAEGIDADIHPTAELLVATNPAQWARAQAEVEHRLSWGIPDRVRLMGAEEVGARLAIPGTLGAVAVGGVARVQPAKLVQGLARTVEALGVRIAEDTAVTRIEPRRVITARGTVTAPVILRATEGFTAGLPGLEREWLALNSAQIVTDPLPPEIWANIGWEGSEIIGNMANAYFYAQRTREGRITMGGRGVPYRMGSRTDHRGEADAETIARLTALLHRTFPATKGIGIAHSWCGVLGVPRDWCATIGFDPATGVGWAGGYVGIGVSTTNLAGRTLADLALGRQTDLTTLPWVNRRVRRWEPEPLRWLGVHGMYALLNAADRREEATSGPPSRLGRLGNWLTGRG